MLNQEEIEMIDRYADLDLSITEINALKKRVEADPVFRIEAEQYLGVRKAIIDKIKEDFEGPNLSVLDKPQSFFFRKMAAALLGLFILISVWTYWMAQNKVEQHHILMAECEKYVYRISGDNMRSTEAEIKVITEAQQFDLELQKITSLYEANKFDLAEAAVKDLRDNTMIIENHEVADWWMCFILLKQNKIYEAQILLQGISVNENYNSQTKAKELLNNIKE